MVQGNVKYYLPKSAVSKQLILGLLIVALTTVILSLASSVPTGDNQPKAATSDTKSEHQPAKVLEVSNSAQTAKIAAESKSEASPSELSDPNQRKGRAELSTPETQNLTEATADQTKTSSSSSASEKSTSASPEKMSPKASEPTKTTDKPKAASAPKPSTKSATKSKLPANLGTVTSTGSGGPTHYMSKHDAYSAIAEKHGALAHEAMRKSDKRQLQPSFGGIHKASGFSDTLNPFRGVGDSGLARTLGASMRSIMKSKFSVPAYVASALLGAVALMAFYESPISPLPVPPLPEPPVGRFPPEMPNISPNIQVPLRANQQQNYNQRQAYLSQPQQQPQQVYFPNINMNSQQRQASDSPVQQLAANLLSAAKQPVAQRKSGLDYDQSSLRSLFGASPSLNPKISVPANQQKSSSFLSYFGLGGSSSDASQPGSLTTNAINSLASNQIEPKGHASSMSSPASGSSLSGSHLVNKVKLLFSRSPSTNQGSSGSQLAGSNSLEQYQKMSFMQALMKDAAFLPSYLTSTRKSSTNASPNNQPIASPVSSDPGNKQAGSNTAAARMQLVGGDLGPIYNVQMAPVVNQAGPKPKSSSFGLVRAADRIAHALLETISLGIMQRQSSTASNPSDQTAASTDGLAARKSSAQEDSSSPLASATSLLSDIVSGYTANVVLSNALNSHDQQAHSSDKSNGSPTIAASQTTNPKPQATSGDSQTARSSESASTIVNSAELEQSKQSQSHNANQVLSKQAEAAPTPQIRKTRSIGSEYPYDNNQWALLHREPQGPSRASQINNLVDFVADSYTNNKLLFNFVMNQVGLSQAVPYVEKILADNNEHH